MNPKAREAKRIRRIAKIKGEILSLLKRQEKIRRTFDDTQTDFTSIGFRVILKRNANNVLAAVRELDLEGRILPVPNGCGQGDPLSFGRMLSYHLKLDKKTGRTQLLNQERQMAINTLSYMRKLIQDNQGN